MQLAGCLLALSLPFAASESSAATIHVTSVVGGGALSGATLYNFDTLAAGDLSADLPGLSVQTQGTAQFVTGSSAGFYAAPVLSGANGDGFGDAGGDQTLGVNTTTYLSTGNSELTLSFSGRYDYFGLLWGSVDDYNFLDFYDGATFLGTISGSDVMLAANGSQDASGTAYVSIFLSGGRFDRVVARSHQYAFEIDNVAVKVSDSGATAALVVLPAGLLAFFHHRRRKLLCS